MRLWLRRVRCMLERNRIAAQRVGDDASRQRNYIASKAISTTLIKPTTMPLR